VSSEPRPEPRVFQIELMGQCHVCGTWTQPVRGYRLEYTTGARARLGQAEVYHHSPSFFCGHCAVQVAIKILELEHL